jgi:Mobilization protein NikA
MSRTLFDLDEKPEPQASERRSAGQRRSAIVPVRLTEGDRDQLAEVARDLGVSLSTYMRQVVLARPLPPRRLGTVRGELLGTSLTAEGDES